MYKIESQNLKQGNHYVAASPDILHAMVEAAFTLSHSETRPYLKENELILYYETIDLLTDDTDYHHVLVSDQTFELNSMLSLVQELAYYELEEEFAIIIRESFPPFVQEMDECSSYNDAVIFAPGMLITLLRYAYLIDQPYQQIEKPPTNMTLTNFYFQLGFINYTQVNFTDLINYFFDFCDYCFDLGADELLKLSMMHLLDDHLNEGQILSEYI